jgi:hypothetical protein
MTGGPGSPCRAAAPMIRFFTQPSEHESRNGQRKMGRPQAQQGSGPAIGLVPGAPFGPGAPHVVPLRPIGIEESLS